MGLLSSQVPDAQLEHSRGWEVFQALDWEPAGTESANATISPLKPRQPRVILSRTNCRFGPMVQAPAWLYAPTRLRGVGKNGIPGFGK